MTQDIGDLLVVGFAGTAPSEEWPALISAQARQRKIGGVILFRYNIAGPAQVRTLTKSLTDSTPFPLLVMVDQEGGKVQRLSSANGFRDWPSAKFSASTLSEDDVEENSFTMALALEEAGINFNCAPCVDLDYDPPSPPIGRVERSYGNNLEVVAKNAAAFVRGHRRVGVVSCVKHFPGHGSAQGDTHQGLVDITSTWSKSELEPYRILANEGLLDSVMAAHLIHNEIDKDVPAVFSARWSALLRQDVGFGGVVVSDDLHMGAIQSNYTFDETILGAFNGGCDLFVFSNNALAAKGVSDFSPDPQLPEKFSHGVQQLVDSGALDYTRVAESLDRVGDLRRKLKIS